MKNNKKEPDFKPLWGLSKKPQNNKPKEKQILETVNRIINQIRMTKGNAYD
jgi:hypothetical protein